MTHELRNGIGVKKKGVDLETGRILSVRAVQSNVDAMKRDTVGGRNWVGSGDCAWLKLEFKKKHFVLPSTFVFFAKFLFSLHPSSQGRRLADYPHIVSRCHKRHAPAQLENTGGPRHTRRARPLAGSGPYLCSVGKEFLLYIDSTRSLSRASLHHVRALKMPLFIPAFPRLL
jgi:hypothetical protein